MDQSKGAVNKKPPTGFAKLAMLAGKSMKSKAQWTDKVKFVMKSFIFKH
jgi:hypothetical protein